MGVSEDTLEGDDGIARSMLKIKGIVDGDGLMARMGWLSLVEVGESRSGASLEITWTLKSLAFSDFLNTLRAPYRGR